MAFVRAEVATTAGHLIIDTYTGMVAPFGTSEQRDMALIELREVGRHRSTVKWAPSPLVLQDSNEVQVALERLQLIQSQFDVRWSTSLDDLQLWCQRCEEEGLIEDAYLCDVEGDDNMSGLSSITVGHWLDRHPEVQL